MANNSLQAAQYIEELKRKYKNRLVYSNATLSEIKREPMIEIYTTLRKDYG